MAAAILPRIEGTATLVPIPNSHVVKPDEFNIPMLKLAEGIAAASGGRLNAAVASVFKEPQEKARKGGPRSATHLQDAYQIVGQVERPIILVDDAGLRRSFKGRMLEARVSAEIHNSRVHGRTNDARAHR